MLKWSPQEIIVCRGEVNYDEVHLSHYFHFRISVPDQLHCQLNDSVWFNRGISKTLDDKSQGSMYSLNSPICSSVLLNRMLYKDPLSTSHYSYDLGRDHYQVVIWVLHVMLVFFCEGKRAGFLGCMVDKNKDLVELLMVRSSAFYLHRDRLMEGSIPLIMPPSGEIT